MTWRKENRTAEDSINAYFDLLKDSFAERRAAYEAEENPYDKEWYEHVVNRDYNPETGEIKVDREYGLGRIARHTGGIGTIVDNEEALIASLKQLLDEYDNPYILYGEEFPRYPGRAYFKPSKNYPEEPDTLALLGSDYERLIVELVAELSHADQWATDQSIRDSLSGANTSQRIVFGDRGPSTVYGTSEYFPMSYDQVLAYEAEHGEIKDKYLAATGEILKRFESLQNAISKGAVVNPEAVEFTYQWTPFMVSYEEVKDNISSTVEHDAHRVIEPGIWDRLTKIYNMLDNE
tara:strand:+ start:119 stop:994 length:876 start_codon:yes stop_codon:yes gene_type:complete